MAQPQAMLRVGVYAVCFVGTVAFEATCQFWVSPTGSDGHHGRNPGTSFATISQALTAVRAQRAQGDDSACSITLGPGTYALASPLSLDDRDHDLTIIGPSQGDPAVISGGVPIIGWKQS
eukprot:gene9192-8278_t